jgi:hypothetical protein
MKIWVKLLYVIHLNTKIEGTVGGIGRPNVD